jgi:hypothetical protein
MSSKDKKHQEFINQYFLCNLNQTEAYLKVYPKSSYDSARANSTRLIAEDSIKSEIEARLAEMKMSADEALIRLTEQARADMADFLRFEDGIKTPFLDLESANKKGLMRLVKKFKYNAAGYPEIELHDSQAAILNVLKIHGKFTEKIEHSGKVDLGIDQLLKTAWGDKVDNSDR